MTNATKGTRRGTANLRRDDAGGWWSEAEVEREVTRLVRVVDPGIGKRRLTRSTRLSGDLGWDDWFKLSVIKPVRERMNESLSATVVLDRVHTVGDLADYVWASMGAVT